MIAQFEELCDPIMHIFYYLTYYQYSLAIRFKLCGRRVGVGYDEERR